MLSPESFYYSLREHYGHPSLDNVFFRPSYDGAKEIQNFMPYLHGDFKTRYFESMNLDEKIKFGSIFLHDQEPIMDLFYLGNTYQKKYFPNRNPNIDEATKILRAWFPSEKSPICCHSEKNSEEISILNNNGFIDCYYWYHGLISLSWFNDWRWCKNLDQFKKNVGAKKFLMYARAFNGTRRYRQKLVDSLYEIRTHINYDWEKQKEITGEYSAVIDVDDALNSHIHIVAETIFNTDKQHLTEKSLKPIVMAQPFIMVSSAGSLEYLKSYGFKTFDSIWDESYDRESDNDRRLSMIVDLIKKLSALSENEFEKIYKKTIPIIEHNRKWFYSDKFYNKLINELETNMENAISRRDEEYQKNPNRWFEDIDGLMFDTLQSIKQYDQRPLLKYYLFLKSQID